MLPKKNRIDKKTLDLVFKKGKFIVSSSLTFKFIILNGGRKVSFVAPKSVANLAVMRNRLRRRGYSVLERFIERFPAGLLGVFIFRKYQDDTLILQNEIKNILNKIN